MNFYLEALQNEHLITRGVLPNYRKQSIAIVESIQALLECGKADRIVFCGMGSSAYAAYTAAFKLNRFGIRAEVRNGYEMLNYAPESIDSKTILVLISQSGNTPEIISVMDKCGKIAAMTVSMVNNPNGDLCGKADIDLYLDVGRETPISNITFYAQLAQLNFLAAALTGENLESITNKICAAIDWHEEFTKKQWENTQSLMQLFSEADLVDLLGDASQYGVAMQAGLILRELTLGNVCAHSLSDYNHGWFEIARKNYLMVIFADRISVNDRKMIDFCTQNGGKALIVSPEEIEGEGISHLKIPQVSNCLMPMYSIVPFYYLGGNLLRERR